MQALIFDTKILQNGFIQIPALSDWCDYEVSIIVVRKPRKKKVQQNKNGELRQNNNQKLLADFHRIRQMKTGQAEILTMEKAINIYDELIDISRQ
jgi:hypothetical protein